MVVVFARPMATSSIWRATSSRAPGWRSCRCLIILTGVFLFHQQGKRQEAKARAAAAEADALQAGTRATEMERLVTFGQALGRSLDLDAIRDVVGSTCRSLPATDDAWVLLRATGQWQALVGTPRESAPRHRARARARRRSGADRRRRVVGGRDRRRRPSVPPDDGRRPSGRRARHSGSRRSVHAGAQARARDGRRAAGDLDSQRAALSRGAREQPARRPDRLLQPHARARGDRHRAAPRAPLADAGLAHHVRHRSLQGHQRSLRPPLRRRGAGGGRRRACATCCAAAT